MPDVTDDSSRPLGFARHDHADCVKSALGAARARCGEEGLQLTPMRRRVLEFLLESHVALGAYEVLARLEAEGLGSGPPTAYRALDFLVRHGFAHRVERLNAFVACTHPGRSHDPAFMICTGCGSVAEAVASGRALGRSAAQAGFAIAHTTVEAEGLCPDCRGAAR